MSTGADGLLKLWTIRTNECEATMDAHSDKVWGLSVRHDGAQIVTGGADSVLNVWRDVTTEQDEAEVAAAEQRTLREHQLLSKMHVKDFGAAIELAFELGHSYRLWCVLSEMLETPGLGGLRCFDSYVARWDDSRLATALEYLRDWNTNATKSAVAQALLGSLLRSVPLERVKSLEGAASLVEGLAAYTERHLQRVDRLVQASYIIDYTCSAMSALGDPGDN